MLVSDPDLGALKCAALATAAFGTVVRGICEKVWIWPSAVISIVTVSDAASTVATFGMSEKSAVKTPLVIVTEPL